MTTFDAAFIAQQRELAGKATRRPWEVVGYDAKPYRECTWRVCSPSLNIAINLILDDAAYIAAACNGYPPALDEIERLQGIIQEVRALALAGHEPGEQAEHTWRMLIANALAEVQDDGNTNQS